MAEPIYVQCTLQRTIRLESSGVIVRTQVAWLPARFGHIDKTVRLQDDKANWTVTDVHGRATAKDVREYEKNHKRTRKASDI